MLPILASSVPLRIPTAADFAICHGCNGEHVYHSAGKCSCREKCARRGFVSRDLAAQRRIDARQEARQWARDDRD